MLAQEKKNQNQKKLGFFFPISPHQDQNLQEGTISCVPSTSKTKVLSAENPIASSKLSRLKDLVKVHAYSFPTHAYGNQGRRKKGSAELDVVLGQILVTQLWEVNTDLTVEVLLK